MRNKFSIGRRLALAAFVFMAFQAAGARSRGPRVEVVCPKPPIPVEIAGKQVLAYELHITNFDSVAVTLQQMAVFSDSGTNASLATLTGDTLNESITVIGSPSAKADRNVIAPGGRIVVFLWAEMDAEAALPRVLRNDLKFMAATQPEPTPSSLQFPVQVSAQRALVLSPPFAGGIWVAGSGPGNGSDHRRSLFPIDGHVWLSQRFASDWMKVGPNGDSNHGTARNEDYWGYGEPVLAVADGEIVQLGDGIQENIPHQLPKPVTLDNILGNYVVLRIAADRFVTYAHLQPGSIKVAVHQRVKRGAALARLGNTGQATAPHLHMQVTDGAAPLESEGVPFVFARYTDLSNGATYELDKHPSDPRQNTLPDENDVVEFR